MTREVIDLINKSDLPVFGCNLTYQFLSLNVLLACNKEFWDFYWPRDELLRSGSFSKWTWDKPTADRYGLSHIRGEWGDGLSTDPKVIHYGHSSGYQLVNLALHYGVTEFVLIGYDLRYPKGYDRAGRKAVQRHFWEGGEYPPELQHWPQVADDGSMTGLLDCYRTINPEDYGIRIINCSQGSALDFFENGQLENEI